MGHTKLELTAVQYGAFYKALWYRIIELEYHGTLPDGVKELSEGIFKEKKDNRSFIYHLLDGTDTNDSRYFFRRYDQSRRESSVLIDPLVLYNGLVYLGYGPDEDRRLLKDIIDRKERASFRNLALLKVKAMSERFFSDLLDPEHATLQKRKLLEKESSVNSNKEAQENEISQDRPLQTDTVTDEEFLKMVDLMWEYYKLRHLEYPLERRFFLGFRRLIKTRSTEYPEFDAFFISAREEAEKTIRNNYYDIFELRDNHIIRYTLKFENGPANQFEETFDGLLSAFSYQVDIDKDFSKGRCDIDILHNLVVVKFDGSDFPEGLSDVFLFSGPLSEHLIGHRLQYDQKKGSVHASISVMRKRVIDTEPPGPFFSIFDKDDPSIPTYAKSILLAPADHNFKVDPFLNIPISLFSFFRMLNV